jgi:streptogramin lyase
VTGIAVAPDGAVWLCAHDAFRFDGQVWTTYPIDGHDLSLYAIAIVPDGTVWFGGSRGGAHRLDGQDYTTYSKVDGLADNSVNAVAVTPDGAVWFGTEHGASRYLPLP